MKPGKTKGREMPGAIWAVIKGKLTSSPKLDRVLLLCAPYASGERRDALSVTVENIKTLKLNSIERS